MLERLTQKLIAKPWGRDVLPAPFIGLSDDRIGEIWYEAISDGAAPSLMVKHIFTSESLSIQVHPDDASARSMGFTKGKDEAWYILDCAPGAVIGLGLNSAVSISTLQAAASDGRILDLIAWKPVRAGDFIYVPARTIHSIGADISLVEVQTNVDLTFRLYDYGRPRPLHVNEAIRSSHRGPYAGRIVSTTYDEDRVLTPPSGAAFQLELHHWDAAEGRNFVLGQPTWFVPLTGEGVINDQIWTAGECWMASGDIRIEATSTAKALTASIT